MEKTESAKPELVGRVASIPSSREFVLIQSYGTWKIETGAILTTVGPEGRAANLRVTGEKLGQFAAADIQSGKLEIGDGVYTSISVPKSNLAKTEGKKPPEEQEDLEEENDQESPPPTAIKPDSATRLLPPNRLKNI